jgi:hypothetical protein
MSLYIIIEIHSLVDQIILNSIASYLFEFIIFEICFNFMIMNRF